MRLGSVRAAMTAQWGAQSLAGVGLVLTLASGDFFNACFLVAALAVTFRRDPKPNDRALSNFAAAVLAWGSLTSALMDSILDPAGGPLEFTPAVLVLLVSTVLFVFAGAFFWLQRKGSFE